MRYVDDSQLPAVSDAELEEALATTRAYTVVILRTGPKYSPPGPDRPPEVARTVRDHGKRNFALRSVGLMPIVCPLAPGSDIFGLSVFDANPEEVDRIMERDPAVAAGIFTYEIYPTWSFPGSTL